MCRNDGHGVCPPTRVEARTQCGMKGVGPGAALLKLHSEHTDLGTWLSHAN